MEAARGHNMEEVVPSTMTRGASLAYGPTASLMAPPTVGPPMASCIERRIALSFVERSTRYAMLSSFYLRQVLLTMFGRLTLLAS